MRKSLWLLLIVILPAPLALFPQQPKYQARVNLVSLDVEVLDEFDNPVFGLTKEKFVVKENGRRMEISNFAWLADRPISLAFVLDTSAISAEKLVTFKRFIRALAYDLARTDELCLYSFDARDAYLELGLTPRRPDLEDALDNVAVPSKGSGGILAELFRPEPPIGLAVDRALFQLRKAGNAKRAVLLISNRFRGLGPATVEHIQESGCTLLTLGSGGKAAMLVTLGGDWISKQALMKQSGGRQFSADAGNMEAVCRAIAFCLKNYYALGYLTEITENEKKPRRAEVQIPGEKYRINYRRTYVVK
jgi:VWFA-related protein